MKLDFSRTTRGITYEERLMYSRLSREQVLALADTEKVRYFYSLRVKHRLRDGTEKKLTDLLGPCTDTGIITLFGPTGGGKTALAETVGSRMCSTEPGHRPYIYVRAPAFGAAKVSWGGFFRKVLEAGREPMIDAKRSWSVRDNRLIGSNGRADLPALQTAVCNMLDNRDTRLLVVDEILHMLRYGDHDKALDSVKDLSDAVSSQILLIGPYELFGMVDNYGQVVRRGDMVYLGRYRNDRPDKVQNKADAEEYKKIITKLMERWPLEQVPQFELVADDLLTATLGIVGLLKEFLTRCLISQLENAGKWKEGFIALALKKKHSIEKIRKEVEDGEAMLIRENFDESAIDPDRIAEMEKLVAGG
ncbi:hypothetical protein P3T20_004940 [Paraburkholderia sp. GAS206C]|uniref:ATP-binding protein n=1 Tax=unclassified Paraburkholderia TaxID=2615204 RepID=UPI003D1D9424